MQSLLPFGLEPDDGLICAFGEPWMGPHPLCEAETERACQQFAEAVRAGKYDVEGYTPAERKAKNRRDAKRLVTEQQ